MIMLLCEASHVPVYQFKFEKSDVRDTISNAPESENIKWKLTQLYVSKIKKLLGNNVKLHTFLL